MTYLIDPSTPPVNGDNGDKPAEGDAPAEGGDTPAAPADAG